MQKQIPTYRDPWARWAKIIFAIVVCATLLSLAGCGLRHQDDSDPPDGSSGIKPRTDALTGCQYLTYPAGGITPRMDRNGKQVCK